MWNELHYLQLIFCCGGAVMLSSWPQIEDGRSHCYISRQLVKSRYEGLNWASGSEATHCSANDLCLTSHLTCDKSSFEHDHLFLLCMILVWNADLSAASPDFRNLLPGVAALTQRDKGLILETYRVCLRRLQVSQLGYSASCVFIFAYFVLHMRICFVFSLTFNFCFQ